MTMTKAVSFLCAIGLTILWIAGLGSPYSASWLTWLDGVAALVGYGVTFGGMRVSGPIGLSVGLFALWIIGMATNGVAWQNWWTFAFACGYLLVGLMAPERRGAITPIERESTDRFRKSA